MSRFNSSISVVGISEVKVQQAILKLLENSLNQRELLGKTNDNLSEQIRRIRQKLASIDFDIDAETAQKIADKISAAIGDSVATATEAARTASSKASIATEKAAQASADAQELRAALQDIEGLIDQKARQAATALIQQTQEAVNGATQAAQQASQSAQNAATTAGQASQAATDAQNAVKSLAFRSLAGATVYNASAAQYRKVATLPAVSGAANATVTFWGSVGGHTNATQTPIYLTVGQRQSATTYSALAFNGYYFGASLPASADIVVYKESNNTFSVYLKGAAATYFRHDLAMIYNENVTPVADTFKTSAPTGTLVWSLVSNAKRVATADEFTNYALATHNHDSAYQPKGSYASATHNHSGVYQPAGSYAAADHNHDSTYQPKGSYASATHNHDSTYQPKGSYAAATHNHDGTYLKSTDRPYIETYSFAVLNTDCGTGNTAFPMAGIVLNTAATYNVRVLFRNTAATARTCVANGTNVSLSGSIGATASRQFTLAGNGTITIDNIATSVDVFITIWR